MIEFYKFVPQFGMRDASPFCLKLATYLRLAGIPHETLEIMDPRKAPKQKMPFIVDGGEEIGDSELVIAHLKSKHGDPLGEDLDASQKAVTHAFNVMLAERYYWAGLIYPRWIHEDGKPLMVQTWFSEIPWPVRRFIVGKIFKDIAKASKSHGVGLHTENEIYKLALSDIKALEMQLGDKAFMLDDQPREIDASAYAFLINTACEFFPNPMMEYVKNSKSLMAYIERVDAAAFG